MDDAAYVTFVENRFLCTAENPYKIYTTYHIPITLVLEKSNEHCDSWLGAPLLLVILRR